MNAPTKTTRKYYKLVKALPIWKKIALWHGLETNTARAKLAAVLQLPNKYLAILIESYT